MAPCDRPTSSITTRSGTSRREDRHPVRCGHSPRGRPFTEVLEYLAVVDDIPLLPSGKLDKLSLIELLNAGKLEKTPIRFRPGA